MTMAVITLRSPLKQLAGDRSRLEIPGETLGEVLTGLEREHPKLVGWVLDEQGHIREHVNVFVKFKWKHLKPCVRLWKNMAYRKK